MNNQTGALLHSQQMLFKKNLLRIGRLLRIKTLARKDSHAVGPQQHTVHKLISGTTTS